MLWDHYVFRRGDGVHELWDDLLKDRPVKLLYIAGRGFDVPLFRPHDESAALFADLRNHNRLRKLRGRFGRRNPGKSYEALARYLAREACATRPELTRVKAALWVYRSLGPADRAAGKVPQGKYESEIVFECERRP